MRILAYFVSLVPLVVRRNVANTWKALEAMSDFHPEFLP